MDCSLTWSAHISRFLNSYLFGQIHLYSLLNSNLIIHNKLLLFKLYLLPRQLYAASVWATAAVTHMCKIQRAVNKSLRTIRRDDMCMRNTTIRSDLNIKTVNEIIIQFAINFHDKLKYLNNVVIACIPDYDPVLVETIEDFGAPSFLLHELIPFSSLLTCSFHSLLLVWSNGGRFGINARLVTLMQQSFASEKSLYYLLFHAIQVLLVHLRSEIPRVFVTLHQLVHVSLERIENESS